MLKRVIAIIQTSFREMYRDRFFLTLVFGVLLLFCLSILLGELSFEEHQRILFDLGISAIHWLNLGLCLFIGGTSLKKELERQTYMTLLASPLSRFELILGKFGGIFLVSVLSTATLGAGLFFLLKLPDSFGNYCAILVGISFEAAVLLSLAMFLSLVLSPFVAAFASIGVFLTSHWLESMHYFAAKSKNETYINFADFMGWVFPNLYRLNWRSTYILETGVPVEVGLMSLAHGFAWAGFFMFCSHVVFKRKNLM
jgi:ABC-type transport system involved in multi-copper enzyme maturation permease subunit